MPGQVIIDRHPNPHLAFGRGTHRCPGAALALLEADIAISLLIRKTPALSLAVPPGQLRWRQGKLRCLEHLPITLTTPTTSF
jgi:cytochrome P450